MVNSVTLNGNTYNDGSTPPGNLGNDGHRTNLIPMLQDFLAEAASLIAATGLLNYGTSTSTINISSFTSGSINIGTNKGVRDNAYIRLVSTVTASNWIEGYVSSYNPSTGACTFTKADSNGSGNLSSWNWYVSGARGSTGATGSLAASGYAARSSNTQITAADSGKIFNCTSTFTQTFVSAATLGTSFFCFIKNNGTGVITFDPNSTETIGGQSTLALNPGQGCTVGSDGTNLILLETIGFPPLYEIIQAQIDVPANQSYDIILNMPFAGKVLSVETESASGTATMTTKINGTNLGGTANAVSSTAQTQAHTTSNTFAVGDDLTMTISSNSSCQKLRYNIKVQRTSLT